MELLRQSPSPPLRAAAPLAQARPAVARELFPAAFVSCWAELSPGAQDALVRSLEAALASPSIPAETVTALLDLAEFMEHDDGDRPLPLDGRALGELAQRCHAFAKALHYKEAEFAVNPEGAVEALISINNALRQPEAAVGVLKVAQRVSFFPPSSPPFFFMFFFQLLFLSLNLTHSPLSFTGNFLTTQQQTGPAHGAEGGMVRAPPALGRGPRRIRRPARLGLFLRFFCFFFFRRRGKDVFFFFVVSSGGSSKQGSRQRRRRRRHRGQAPLPRRAGALGGAGVGVRGGLGRGGTQGPQGAGPLGLAGSLAHGGVGRHGGVRFGARRRRRWGRRRGVTTTPDRPPPA